MDFIIIALLLVSAVSKAVMDSISHGFSQSIFSNLNPLFWDPKVSWKNKWKYENRYVKLIMSTWLVMFTDAWHLFQFLAYKSIILAIALSTVISLPEFVNWVMWAVILAIMHQSFFHFFYSWFRRIPVID
jgi:hypothetical protein